MKYIQTSQLEQNENNKNQIFISFSILLYLAELLVFLHTE